MRILLLTFFTSLFLGSILNAAELRLVPESGDFSPDRLSLGQDGAIFVLDRAHAQVYRFSPEDGSQVWRVDGTEGGEAFVDPVYLSRGDGFYIYLTDRGSRKVWRIDYRGEIRGSLDLPFAVDPVFFELAAGHQMVLYDRATALVHLLDDSGRSLFSFTLVGKAAEPVDFAVTEDGKRLFVLWSANPGLSVTDLFGRKSYEPVAISGLDSEPLRLSLSRFPVVITKKGSLFMTINASIWGKAESLSGEHLRDVENGADGLLHYLADNPPRIMIPDKEQKN